MLPRSKLRENVAVQKDCHPSSWISQKSVHRSVVLLHGSAALLELLSAAKSGLVFIRVGCKGVSVDFFSFFLFFS